MTRAARAGCRRSRLQRSRRCCELRHRWPDSPSPPGGARPSGRSRPRSTPATGSFKRSISGQSPSVVLFTLGSELRSTACGRCSASATRRRMPGSAMVEPDDAGRTSPRSWSIDRPAEGARRGAAAALQRPVDRRRPAPGVRPDPQRARPRRGSDPAAARQRRAAAISRRSDQPATQRRHAADRARACR